MEQRGGLPFVVRVILWLTVMVIAAAAIIMMVKAINSVTPIWTSRAEREDSASLCWEKVRRLEARAEAGEDIQTLRGDEGRLRRIATLPAMYGLSRAEATVTQLQWKNIQRQIRFLGDSKYGVAEQRRACVALARNR